LTVQADGQAVQWALSGVTIDTVSLAPGALSIRLHFDAIQESVKAPGGATVTEGWNFITDRPTGLPQQSKGPAKAQGPRTVQYDPAIVSKL
jgi:hypothetical protein